VAHRNVTVSEVVDVAVTVCTVKPPAVDDETVTPAENVAVRVSGVLITIIPEPPWAGF
jgi:hypothetical protein